MTKKLANSAFKSGGDDLDDGLALEPDFLASDSEAESSAAGSLRALSVVGSDREDFVYAGDDLDEEESAGIRQPQLVAGIKRKAASPELGEEARKAEQRKKRRQKDKERKAKKRERRANEVAAEIDPSRLTADELEQLLLTSIREAFPSATPIEIDDLRIPADMLLPALEGNLAGHDEFAAVQTRVNSLLKSPAKHTIPIATPRIIILSLSGIRCADIVRGVRDVKAQGGVAKLFAKHFKLKDQIAYLSTARVSIAVGTPARVAKLLEAGALRVTKETAVLLDIGFRDSKTRTLLTSPEVRVELWKALLSGQSRTALLGNGARFGAF